MKSTDRLNQEQSFLENKQLQRGHLEYRPDPLHERIEKLENAIKGMAELLGSMSVSLELLLKNNKGEKPNESKRKS